MSSIFDLAPAVDVSIPRHFVASVNSHNSATFISLRALSASDLSVLQSKYPITLHVAFEHQIALAKEPYKHLDFLPRNSHLSP